jgi:hypothetical protein
MDTPQEESGPPAWLLAAGLAVAVVLLLIYLFATPGRFLTGLALVLTGGPMTLGGFYLMGQQLFGGLQPDEGWYLLRRFSRLIFIFGVILFLLGLAALFGG